MPNFTMRPTMTHHDIMTRDDLIKHSVGQHIMGPHNDIIPNGTPNKTSNKTPKKTPNRHT